MNIFQKWYHTYLRDPQVLIFIILGTAIIIILMTLGKILTPVIASLILAYLLEGLIKPLEKKGFPRIIAVCIVFFLFLLALLFLVLGLIPLLSKQIGQFLQDLPKMIATWKDQLMRLPERYPHIVNESEIERIVDTLNTMLGQFGQNILSFSIASVRSIINIIIYMVIVPLMIFFLLKDKYKILKIIKQSLPENIGFASQVWQEVNHKIAKFIQGKIWEIFIVWFVSYITFFIFNLKFSVLLSLLVGLSVIVPYVGATVMTIPVALVAYFQWGFTNDFMYVLMSYFIIQILDGNLLVPLLLSEIVKLHPLAIIIGILVFGGLWGGWGVLFAIPLVTLVHAIFKSWPIKNLSKT
ncbi:MAG TPA: AI-2E family transporter [Desulfohalobiaceae bacterium]|nr:AI-2E family transporter [Desulfohalobiaceae bacterium]